MPGQAGIEFGPAAGSERLVIPADGLERGEVHVAENLAPPDMEHLAKNPELKVLEQVEDAGQQEVGIDFAVGVDTTAFTADLAAIEKRLFTHKFDELLDFNRSEMEAVYGIAGGGAGADGAVPVRERQEVQELLSPTGRQVRQRR